MPFADLSISYQNETEKRTRVRARFYEGEWVEVDSRPAPASEIDERTTLPMDSWATSSMDLREGMHIVELDDPPSGPTIAP